LEWGRAHNGIADVSGVSAEQLQAFSTRAGEIDAYLAEHSWSGAAALRTREPRTQGVRDPARQHRPDGLGSMRKLLPELSLSGAEAGHAVTIASRLASISAKSCSKEFVNFCTPSRSSVAATSS
jgi:hypothetical protein